MESRKQEMTRLLLVDDDLILGRLMSAMAKRMNVALDHVANFSQIPDERILEIYNVIILDYDLVETTGFDLAEQLLLRLPETPVLLFSSTNRPWQDEFGNIRNIKGFISKWNGFGNAITIAMDVAKGKVKSNLKEKMPLTDDPDTEGGHRRLIINQDTKHRITFSTF